MHLQSLLFVLAAGSVGTQALAISKPHSHQEFGVGFSLSIDYATASIYYPDGSYVDLIKTEGSKAYRELMQKAGRDSLALRAPQDGITQPRILAQVQETQVSLHSRLSEWFDVEDTNAAMSDMFEALTMATEAYLERPIEIVDVAIPFPMTPQLEASIVSAYQATSLDYARPPQMAGLLATKYEGLVGSCSESPDSHDDPAQLIVAVDYNRAAFTLSILEEECGVVSWRRIEHEERFGDAAMRKCKAQYGDESCDQEFISFIKKSLQPLEEDDAPSYISTMLLVGEYSMSTKIMYHVKEELGKQVPVAVASDPTHRYKQHIKPVDPVFAAARAAGWDAWNLMSRARKAEAQLVGSLESEL